MKNSNINNLELDKVKTEATQLQNIIDNTNTNSTTQIEPNTPHMTVPYATKLMFERYLSFDI
jgi:hypothetical protein